MAAICSGLYRTYWRVIGALRTPQTGRTMASGSKRKTTMAKLNRERRLVERRLEKQAKKLARKQAASMEQSAPPDTLTGNDG
jgi:hypothetical protein